MFWRALSYARRRGPSKEPHPLEFLRQRTKFAAIAFVLWLGMTSFAVTAKAVEANVRNDSFSALRDYVLSIDTSRKSTDSDQTLK